MPLIDEGYIKYKIDWKNVILEADDFLLHLMHYRDKLKYQNLIGVYPDGIGYGNISQRINSSIEFYISGTQTGFLINSAIKDYSKVTDFSFSQNSLHCEGEVKASSESLTHGAFYIFGYKINAVIHVHHKNLWNTLLGIVPTTPTHIKYGTPEMAFEIQRLITHYELSEKQILVMAGHEEGIFTFGESLEEAYDVLMQYMDLYI
ncbi:MAG: class II aldolase/adducin family protein [Bacteroidetes bacterium]|nr:class II aldolase/adducin family protein [Bacteroidota bacterium]